VQFLNEIATIFLDECPRMVQEIRFAWARGDAEALQHAAHTLKGCVANFGAGPAREAAFRLEAIGGSGDLARAPVACADLESELAHFTEALSALSGAQQR
jgi:HPt (histidine-containing phosphotransfer) domain-containing protein